MFSVTPTEIQHFCLWVLLALDESIICLWACNTKINSYIRYNSVTGEKICYQVIAMANIVYGFTQQTKWWKTIVSWMRTSLTKHKSYLCAREYHLRKYQCGVCLVLLSVWLKQPFYSVADCKRYRGRKVVWLLTIIKLSSSTWGYLTGE